MNSPVFVTTIISSSSSSRVTSRRARFNPRPSRRPHLSHNFRSRDRTAYDISSICPSPCLVWTNASAHIRVRCLTHLLLLLPPSPHVTTFASTLLAVLIAPVVVAHVEVAVVAVIVIIAVLIVSSSITASSRPPV